MLKLFMLTLAFFICAFQVNAQKKSWGAPPSADTLKNPYTKNASFTEKGRVLYGKSCSPCHGKDGKGDGVAASGLQVKPADHTSQDVQSQSDGAIFWELTKGHAPMPDYKTIYSKKQRWELVSFIRTLKGK